MIGCVVCYAKDERRRRIAGSNLPLLGLVRNALLLLQDVAANHTRMYVSRSKRTFYPAKLHGYNPRHHQQQEQENEKNKNKNTSCSSHALHATYALFSPCELHLYIASRSYRIPSAPARPRPRQQLKEHARQQEVGSHRE